ncbi:DNA helicase [Anaeromicropila populeti]|uniref:Uncharacterized protein n=1 Tax=Anaeromicropila populeti TaxID=37658 RepID=A0A1I6JIA5_9FIRM|nr:DNA helicase [Anaeromicropila populeti]SFR78624.1 hypothetical protein SAMN05661086_01709 [Anaeromicropila populeti]
MIQEIKRIVENYLNNEKLCSIMIGTVVEEGIKVSDKLTVPNELIVGNLKKTIVFGDSVRLLRNHGGQQFYILEVIE